VTLCRRTYDRRKLRPHYRRLFLDASVKEKPAVNWPEFLSIFFFAQILSLFIAQIFQLRCFFLLLCRNLFFKPLADFEIFCILFIMEGFNKALKKTAELWV